MPECPNEGENTASHDGANHTSGRSSTTEQAEQEIQSPIARPYPGASPTEPPSDLLAGPPVNDTGFSLRETRDGVASVLSVTSGATSTAPPATSKSEPSDSASARRCSDTSAPRQRPRIHVSAETAEMEDAALDVLATTGEAYQREHVGLARVTVTPTLPDDVSEKDRERRPPPGIPAIVAAPAGLVASWLSRHIEWVGYDGRKKEEKQVRVPSEVVSGILARRGEELRKVPVLRGIVESPFMRRDGTLCTEHGYDARTGVFLQWSGKPLRVPERPTRDDARRAAAELAAPFCEFVYQGEPRHNIAGTIASMMTPLARHAIEGPVPAFGWEANAPTAGKTLTANACSIVVTGRVAPVRHYTPNDDEMEKRMGAIAIEGCPIVLLDDVTEHVAGGCVQGLLTAEDTYALRILGYSETKTFRWRATMFWTFNNVSVSGDMKERFVMTRLLSRGRMMPDETPGTQSRAYVIPDLLEYMREHRDRMLTNLLTILRAHTNAGRPSAGVGREKYPVWTRIVCNAVAWSMSGAEDTQGVKISGGDPSLAQTSKEANRDDCVAERIIVNFLDAFGPEHPMTTGQIIDAVKDADESKPGARGPSHAAALVALRQAIEDLANKGDIAQVSRMTIARLIENRVMNRAFTRDEGGTVCMIEAGKLNGSRRVKVVIRRDAP